MGFMDKAKQLAEQAQQKLDEAQESFNQNQVQPAASEPGGARYDEHGRPIAESPPEGAAPPPGGDANATPDPFKPLQQ